NPPPMMAVVGMATKLTRKGGDMIRAEDTHPDGSFFTKGGQGTNLCYNDSKSNTSDLDSRISYR
ncbi:hypothetical protein, partial [Novipirellula maiorica]|uniref:hypothetical protein n=1 Tax=Novipirellula maiorica TaxID=1265734 RepID=UPI001F399C84